MTIEIRSINTPGEECIAVVIRDGDEHQVHYYPTGTTFAFDFTDDLKMYTPSKDLLYYSK